MNADPTAFKRATNVALIGLLLQIAVSIVFLVYAVLAHDDVVLTSFFYAALGIPVWIGLALVFHQHRLERLEALEAEIYAESSAAQASVFGEMEDELRLAARRLAWMHRLLLPALSVLVGAALIGFGLLRYFNAASRPEIIFETDRMFAGWAVAIGIGIAVLGFIFARFVAGMAQIPAWRSLRAGASTAVGVSIIGLAIAVAHGAATAGSELIIRSLDKAVPIFMIVLGAEVFLNFILNIYRPRRTGEIPEPGFSSPILGFLAAPDRFVESIGDAINYQFGFEVSSSWFYQLLSRSFFKLMGLGVLLIYLMTCFVIVEPNEQALKLRFGRVVETLSSGAHVKAPWPFDIVERYPVGTITQANVGTPSPSGEGAILWTQAHGDESIFFIVQPTPAATSARTGDATDLSLIAVEVIVSYRVSDLEKFTLLAVDGPRGEPRDAIRTKILTASASAVLTRELAGFNVDQILGSEQSEISEHLRRRITQEFSDIEAGLEVVFVGIASAHPPMDEEVALAFEEVVAAEQIRLMFIEDAREKATRTLAEVAGRASLAEQIIKELDTLEHLQDTNATSGVIAQQELAIEDLLQQAGGEAASLIHKAKADRWRKHLSARAEANRLVGRIAMYQAAPDVYPVKLYYEAFRDAARNARLFITAFDTPDIRIDMTEISTNLSGFDIETSTEE